MRLWCCIALLFLLVCTCHSAHADGCYVPRIDNASAAKDISEPTQKALLIHRGNRERLILQVSYRGNIPEFLWLVPTPTKPNVSLFQFPVFHELASATAPRLRYWLAADRLWDGDLLFPPFGVAVPRGARSTVDVLERRQIGVYDISVLRASNASDLLKWLRTNGYRVDGRAQMVLADYIRRGWVFTAARIIVHQRAVTRAMTEGTLQAMQLDFAAKEPVYPLAISSLNPGTTRVLIYAVAEHRLVANGLKTVCVLDGRDRVFRMLARDALCSAEGLTGDRIRHRTYLTKLTGEFSSHETTGDLPLLPASEDRAFRVAEVSPSFVENLGALCTLVIVTPFMLPLNFITMMICYRRAKHLRQMGRPAFFWYALAIYAFCSYILSPVVVVPSLMLLGEQYGYWPVGVAVPIVACAVLLIWLVKRTRPTKNAAHGEV